MTVMVSKLQGDIEVLQVLDENCYSINIHFFKKVKYASYVVLKKENKLS